MYFVNDLVFSESGKWKKEARYDDEKQKIYYGPLLGKRTYYIDEVGIKHIKKYDDNWQELECDFNDILQLNPKTGKWEVVTSQSILKKVEFENKVHKIMQQIKLQIQAALQEVLEMLNCEKLDSCIGSRIGQLQVLGTEIIYLVRDYVNITLNDLYLKLADYMAGKTSPEEVLSELKTIPADKRKVVIQILAEIAKITKELYLLIQLKSLRREVKMKVANISSEVEIHQLIEETIKKALKIIRDLKFTILS